jgi:ankyrin repeat protein
VLDLAIKHGNENAVRFLLERGANANLNNKNGFSPLQIAVATAANANTSKQRETSLKIIELILTKGGNINYCKDGKTALSIAALGNNLFLTRIFLPKTSLPNIKLLLQSNLSVSFNLVLCGNYLGIALTETKSEDSRKKLFDAFKINRNCFFELLIYALKNKNIFNMDLTPHQLTELKSFAENLLADTKISIQQRKEYLQQIRAFEAKADVSEQDKIQAPPDVAQNLPPIIKPQPATVPVQSAAVSAQPAAAPSQPTNSPCKPNSSETLHV